MTENTEQVKTTFDGGVKLDAVSYTGVKFDYNAFKASVERIGYFESVMLLESKEFIVFYLDDRDNWVVDSQTGECWSPEEFADFWQPKHQVKIDATLILPPKSRLNRYG